MDVRLADALVEVYLSALELLGASLGVHRAPGPDDGGTADDLQVACVEALVVARSLRHAGGHALLRDRIALTRDRFLLAEALLRRLGPVCPWCGPSISASIEIAERGAEAAARAARSLEAEAD